MMTADDSAKYEGVELSYGGIFSLVKSVFRLVSSAKEALARTVSSFIGGT